MYIEYCIMAYSAAKFSNAKYQISIFAPCHLEQPALSGVEVESRGLFFLDTYHVTVKEIPRHNLILRMKLLCWNDNLHSPGSWLLILFCKR